MSIRSRVLAAFAGLAFAAAAAPAFAGSPAADGVLDELPAHPPAGTCYARVKVLSEQGPPPGPRAVWKQTAALPGAVGPTWCLVLEPGVAPPPAPERFGWVRVLCDTDATPDRIRHIQHRLHAHGDYAGAETGVYDQTTADAVASFQRSEHIDHGGYLSLQTVEAIEHAKAAAPVIAPPAALPPIHVTGCCAPPPPPVQVPVPVPVRIPVPVPQPYPVYVPVPQPCCVAPPPPVCCAAPPPPQPCCGGQAWGHATGYRPAYPPPPIGRDRDGWLTWPGKTLF